MPPSVSSDSFKTDWGNESHSELSSLKYFQAKNIRENFLLDSVILWRIRESSFVILILSIDLRKFLE